jgi:hypothetical protein
MGACEPPCFKEVVGAAEGVESGTVEGVLGAGAGEPDADGESPAPPNPSSSAYSTVSSVDEAVALSLVSLDQSHP